MAEMVKEIIVKQERRQVAVLTYESERLGLFHKWSYDHVLAKDFAVVEFPNGYVEYIPMERIRFLPIGNGISPQELETIYRENGILKG